MIAESNKGNPQEGILTSIRAALEKDTRINLHRYPISLSFQDGDLVVEGEAENIMAKKLALEIAGGVRGFHPIVDRLRVTPAEPMGDAEIRDHVLKVLLQESAFERCFLYSRVGDGLETLYRDVPDAAGSIVVEVNDGVVTLNGEVPSLSHKRLAGALAWWVPGCRDVVNGLEEVPPEEDNDDELTDAVRLVLEKNPFVNATKIRVHSKDWIVTLEGLVPNETMKRMAERDAWCVLGVKRVVNKIAVRW
ncbi:MAG: BON domain-containing protein [Deltaproteobacteria bacterium]|nr:BON domain-containing protein [Deltaproteobacteria bacterium]